MAEVKCKKCGKLFLTEAEDRKKFPVCSECLRVFHEWLERELMSAVAVGDDLYYLRRWVR